MRVIYSGDFTMFDNALLELLDNETVQTSASITHGDTSARPYREILRHLNVTSFSQLEVFQRCPRKFQMQKQNAARNTMLDFSQNVDFAFGHAVGAGIQNYLITRDIEVACFNAMLAWNADWTAEIPKKRKNLWGALLAVEKFAATVIDGTLEDWELLILPNGKPAIEVSFSFHCGNGFKHYAHMDIALRNKRTRQIAVMDCKTTGMTEPEEAIYSNSTQALSYAIMLETVLQEDIVDYDVMYLVYSSTDREWHNLVFTKSSLDQAEFIKDLLLTQDMIKTYNEVGFFPKRGNACYEFFRRCEYYGECNLVSDEPLPIMEDDVEAEKADYVITLTSVVETLKEKRHGKR